MLRLHIERRLTLPIKKLRRILHIESRLTLPMKNV